MNGERGCLRSSKKTLVMMGKSCFYKEFYSSLLKLWKMKGVGMVIAKWGTQKIHHKIRILRMNACLWTILLLHQCIVRNFSRVDTRWVANFSWDYCKLFLTMPNFSCKNEIAQGNLHCLQFRNLPHMLA